MAEKYNSNNAIKDITDKLEQGIKDLYTSERYSDYLKTMSNFSDYSFRNSLLIQLQKPGSSYVAGYRTWEKEFGRHVNKGEKAIKILAPIITKNSEDKYNPDTGEIQIGKGISFRAVSVFDISQTDGKELPSILNRLEANVTNYNEFLEILKNVSPVPIAFEPMETRPNLNGYFSLKENRIAIKNGLSEAQTLKTGIHEIAHALLHKEPDKNGENNTPTQTRNSQEVEAESVAFCVCNHFNIDTSDYSFGYIAGWSKDKELKDLKSSLDTIQKTSKELINSIDAKMKELSIEIPIEKNNIETPEKEFTDILHEEPLQKNNIEPIKNTDKEFINAFDGEPFVKVIWTESSKLEDGKILPLYEADKLFKMLDFEHEGQGYDKTSYEIKYLKNNEVITYDGRVDFGDKIGGIVENIEDLWQYNLTPEMVSLHEEHGNQHIIEMSKVAIEEFLPFLKSHNNLSEIKENFNSLNVINEVNEYVQKARISLNNDTEFPSMEELKNHIINQTVETPFDIDYLDFKTFLDSKIESSFNLGEFGQNECDYLKLNIDNIRTISLSDIEKFQNENPGINELPVDIENEIVDKHIESYRENYNYKEKVLEEIKSEAQSYGISEEAYKDSGYFAPTDRYYSIYQMKDDDTTKGIRFENLNNLEKLKIVPSLKYYDEVYTHALMSRDATLDSVYEDWNTDTINNNRSLSIGDIIAVEYNGTFTANFVDSVGFKNIPSLAQEIESFSEKTEQNFEHNYDKFDGIVNNERPISFSEQAEQNFERNYDAVDGIVNNESDYVQENNTKQVANTFVGGLGLGDNVTLEKIEDMGNKLDKISDTNKKPSISDVIKKNKEKSNEIYQKNLENKTTEKEKSINNEREL